MCCSKGGNFCEKRFAREQPKQPKRTFIFATTSEDIRDANFFDFRKQTPNDLVLGNFDFCYFGRNFYFVGDVGNVKRRINYPL